MPMNTKQNDNLISEALRAANFSRDRIAERNLALVEALVNLCRRVNGKMGCNPYAVPEYNNALKAIADAIGWRGDYLDTLEQYSKAEEALHGKQD